jgi:hypothetical protein
VACLIRLLSRTWGSVPIWRILPTCQIWWASLLVLLMGDGSGFPRSSSYINPHWKGHLPIKTGSAWNYFHSFLYDSTIVPLNKGDLVALQDRGPFSGHHNKWKFFRSTKFQPHLAGFLHSVLCSSQQWNTTKSKLPDFLWCAYLVTCIGSVGIEENGSASLILVHQAWILEMCNESCFSLYAGISKRCYFFTIEFLPFLSIKCLP